jgi:hypothetical protein
MPKRRGMEGPVRSMSRIPTEWPASERERASCVVIEDLPTPPLPDRTYSFKSDRAYGKVFSDLPIRYASPYLETFCVKLPLTKLGYIEEIKCHIQGGLVKNKLIV